MNTASKLLAFAAIVTVAFGGAAAVGAAVGPIDVGGETAGHAGHSGGESIPRGLAVAADGYRLAVDTTNLAGASTRFGFSIVDNDGVPVTAFDELHERRLHLIVLSRNLVDYHHLHPAMDTAGHWSIELPPLGSGSYRVFADFQPTGAANLTLGTDITVAGDVHAVALPEPNTVSEVDGYTVTMAGTPTVGDTELHFTVEHGGEVVRTDPYLGAAGHLVAIRQGDLAYLHVHPHGDDSNGDGSNGDTASPVVTFTGEFPTAGTYRLFFDFSHGGTVRTASFTVNVANGGH
jgi:hypothetical protein